MTRIGSNRGKCGQAVAVQALVLVHRGEDEHDREARSGKLVVMGFIFLRPVVLGLMAVQCYTVPLLIT